MLLELSLWLKPYISGFNLFSYVTLRAILAALTALLVSLAVGPWMIRKLASYKVGQSIRDDGPKSHFSKAGTPTMGGSLIIAAVTSATLLWADLRNHYVWILLFVLISFGAIGFIDDYKKLILKNSKGLSAKSKYAAQSVFGAIAAYWLFVSADVPQATTLYLPFLKQFAWPMGIFFIVVAYFWIVGFSNAVNLTDGLDGLAIMPTVLVSSALGVFAYVAGHMVFAKYLGVPNIPGSAEVVIFCAALGGAGLGFLWFNSYPAMVFMGDVGALAIGAALGAVAVIVRQEAVLVLMGGIFVVETLSVMLQVASFKLTGKRIFRMAPLHHHFELKGWPEPRVIVRFWIISVVLVLLGLATLKVR